MRDLTKKRLGFPFRVSLSKPNSSLPFDCLTGGSACSSVMTFGSHEDIRESKCLGQSFPKSLLCAFPMAATSKSVSKSEAASTRRFSANKSATPGIGTFDLENHDGAPLLNYTYLYRQFIDPNDELLSYPVCEEKQAEPTNVVY